MSSSTRHKWWERWRVSSDNNNDDGGCLTVGSGGMCLMVVEDAQWQWWVGAMTMVKGVDERQGDK